MHTASARSQGGAQIMRSLKTMQFYAYHAHWGARRTSRNILPHPPEYHDCYKKWFREVVGAKCEG